MSSILDKIILDKKLEVEISKAKLSQKTIEKKIDKTKKSFINNLKQKPISCIAECKKASPSEGTIKEDFDLKKIIDDYKEFASAISVLTDQKYFQGKLENLKIVAEYTDLPKLRKDFIIDEYQIFEARYYDADSFLLIASVLSTEKLTKMISIGRELNMEALVEVRNENECHKAIKSDAKIIGINNRNLNDFTFIA